MAYTEAQITALERAIATGTTRVRAADGSEVTYRSLAEMRDQLAQMKLEVNGTPVNTTVQPTYDRGLG